MRRITGVFLILVSAAAFSFAQSPWSFKGTVTRMRMIDCVPQRGFVAAMSGTPAQAGGTCPEYTIMSDKVVYVVVGRHADEFIPLAENMDFLIRKNELVLFSDDEKTKSHFAIQQMMLRQDWDREQARRELAEKMMERTVNYDGHNQSRASVMPTSAK